MGGEKEEKKCRLWNGWHVRIEIRSVYSRKEDPLFARFLFSSVDLFVSMSLSLFFFSFSFVFNRREKGNPRRKKVPSIYFQCILVTQCATISEFNLI